MISKVVPADSVYHTCRYICIKPGSEVLTTDGVREYDYKLMAEDFIRQQQLRPEKHKAFFHGILSFHPSEKLSDEILKTIAGQYLQKLGIVNTQYSVVKHTDKSHMHLHVVANLVDNDGKAIKDNFIGLRGKKIAQQLTLEHKLVQAINKDLSLTHVENMNEYEAARYRIYMAIAENLSLCNTMEKLATRLRQKGIDTQFKYKGQTQEIQGVSFKTGNFSFKGSQIDRKFSFAGLQKALSQGIPNDIEHDHNLKEESTKQQSNSLLLRKPHTFQNRISHKPTSNDTPQQKENHLLTGMDKAVEILLKTESTGENLPYELTQEAHLRKNKQKQRRHKL